MDSSTMEQLLSVAREAADRAHCPYSGFRVGAAALACGQIFPGCNIENASFGLTMCAERVAICSAVAAGCTQLEAIAVTCPDAPEDAPASKRMPCGACRQVIGEFGKRDCRIIVDRVGTFRLLQLLPSAFRLE